MTDTNDKLLREAARGQEARDLIENTIYRDAFETVEASILEKWKDCPVKDVDSQHELKQMFHVLSEVRRYIQTVAETGKMAQIQLESDGKIKKLARRVGF